MSSENEPDVRASAPESGGEPVPPVGRGWEVRFEHEWVRDGWRMHIWRRLPDNRIEVVTGELLVTTYDAHEQVEQSGIHLPADAYGSIVKAIDPPAHGAEVRRLEEALAVERHRVDAVLAAVQFGSDGGSDG